MERGILVRLGTLLTLLLACLLVYLPEGAIDGLGQTAGVPFAGGRCEEGMLCVFFLDVGQGDAALIESPTGVQVLIDGGPDGSVVGELSTVMGYFDRTLDVVVATHPDKDHVAGLVDVFERYEVSILLRTENESDTAVWETFLDRIDAEGASVTFARRGQTYDLGGGVKLEILFPDVDPREMESNTSSIIARLTYGEISFLFTGDAPKSIEEYLVLTEGEHLKSDVLKVGHHGSRTSTSELFLEEVDPAYAVISYGADNSYGHPHVEVTDALFNRGVKILETAQGGTVGFHTDGVDIEVR